VPRPRAVCVGPGGEARRVHLAPVGAGTAAPRGAGVGLSHRGRAPRLRVVRGPGGAAGRGGADASGAYGEAGGRGAAARLIPLVWGGESRRTTGIEGWARRANPDRVALNGDMRRQGRHDQL